MQSDEIKERILVVQQGSCGLCRAMHCYCMVVELNEADG